MKDLCLELCTDDFTWDTFISGAQQGSVFARSCVLNEIGDTTHKYFVKKAGKRRRSTALSTKWRNHFSCPSAIIRIIF